MHSSLALPSCCPDAFMFTAGPHLAWTHTHVHSAIVWSIREQTGLMRPRLGPISSLISPAEEWVEGGILLSYFIALLISAFIDDGRCRPARRDHCTQNTEARRRPPLSEPMVRACGAHRHPTHINTHRSILKTSSFQLLFCSVCSFVCHWKDVRPSTWIWTHTVYVHYASRTHSENIWKKLSLLVVLSWTQSTFFFQTFHPCLVKKLHFKKMMMDLE